MISFAAYSLPPHFWKNMLGLLLLCVGVGATLTSVVLRMDLVNRVNDLLPKEEQFEPFLWGPKSSCDS